MKKIFLIALMLITIGGILMYKDGIINQNSLKKIKYSESIINKQISKIDILEIDDFKGNISIIKSDKDRIIFKGNKKYLVSKFHNGKLEIRTKNTRNFNKVFELTIEISEFSPLIELSDVVSNVNIRGFGEATIKISDAIGNIDIKNKNGLARLELNDNIGKIKNTSVDNINGSFIELEDIIGNVVIGDE